MAKCIFCGDYAGASIRVPYDYISHGGDRYTDPRIADVQVTLPICEECRELLHGISYASLERAARQLASSYRERYAHLLSELKWTREELQELGYSLRSTIELSQRVHLEIKDRVDRCDRAGYLGPEIPDELRDDLEYEVRQHVAAVEASERMTSGANEPAPGLEHINSQATDITTSEFDDQDPSDNQQPAGAPETAPDPYDEQDEFVECTPALLAASGLTDGTDEPPSEASGDGGSADIRLSEIRTEEPAGDEQPACYPASPDPFSGELDYDAAKHMMADQAAGGLTDVTDEPEPHGALIEGGESASAKFPEAAIEEPQPKHQPYPVGSVQPVAHDNDRLLRSGLDLTLLELVERSNFASVRLASRASSEDVFRIATVRDFLDDPDSVHAALCRVSGLGDRIISELVRLIRSYADAVADAQIQFIRSDASPAKSGRLAITLSQLVSLSTSPSVRLVNCAKQDDIFHTARVRDYLDHPAPVLRELQRVRAMGRKTLDELDQLIKWYVQAVADERVPDLPLPSIEDKAGPSVPERITAMTLGELVSLEPVSNRLANCIASDADAAAIPLRLAVENRQEFVQRIRRIWSLGRKTRDELLELIDRAVARATILAGPSDGDMHCDQGTELPSGMQEILRRIEQEAEGTLARRALENVLAAGLGPEVLEKSARETVLEVLADLSDKHRYVLEHRFGLNGSKAKTLEEISRQVHVTRERVRQVENKALRTLRTPGRLWPFQRLVHEEQAEAWEALTGGRPVLTQDMKRTNLKVLDPLFLLSIAVVHDGSNQWLDAYASSTPNGWVGPDNDVSTMSGNRSAVKETLKAMTLPQPLAAVAARANLEIRDVEGALHLSNGMRVHDGYVHAGFLGPQAKRTANLHRLALQIPDRIFDVQTLASRYRQAHPEDQAGSRMLLMQMSEAPHLFAQLFDSIWCALPATPETCQGERSIPYEAAIIDDDGGFEDNSLGAWIADYLRLKGPSRLVDIRDSAMNSTAGGKYSKASVGAMLSSYPCFRKVAPGVFDIYSGSDTTDDHPTLSLLSERQCRFYAYARFGGEPPNSFPLWNRSLEKHLCTWARDNASTETFRSLLYVAEPGSWPVEDRTRVEWLRLKKNYGSWELAQSRRMALGSRFPRPEDVLAALIHLTRLGTISWFSVNRTSQNKLDNHDAADTLAFLVAIGAVTEPAHWQMPHRATHKSRDILERIQAERCHSGVLSWDAGVLRTLLEQAGSATFEGNWIPAPEFAAMIEARKETRQTQPVREASVPKLEGLDDMFESDDWNSLFTEDPATG